MNHLKSRRRRFQFSLRSLGLSTAMICVGLAWLVHERDEVQKRKAAIQAIENLGGAVFFDEKRPGRAAWLRRILGDEAPGEVVRIELYNSPIGDADMVLVRRFSSLRELVLDGTEVSDVGISRLAGLRRLEQLHLDATRVSDGGLVHLAELSQLKELTISHTAITDAGLARLAGLTNLERLGLRNTQVTDAGLVNLVGLTHLKWIDLYKTKVTNLGKNALQEAVPRVKING